MSIPASQVEGPRTRAVFREAVPGIVLGIFVLASALAALAISFVIVTGKSPAHRDFISYWAAGKQLVQGQNPYSAGAVLALERTAGFGEVATIMRNPPSALFLAIPLGFTGARIGSILWSLLILGCLACSIRIMGRMCGKPAGRLHLLGYLFAPSLACLVSGQTGIFVLLGLVLFLRLHDSRPLLAGMALSLCAFKPHLFLPFAAVLLAWIVTRKAYRILAGAALAMGACCAVPLFFDPFVWRQYLQMAGTSGIEKEFMPVPAVFLRFALDRDAMWLQFLPALAACLWALWYFHRHRADWDWQRHGALLMLVSLLAAPYFWFTDEVVLLPALLQGLDSGKSLTALLALMGAATAQIFFGGVFIRSALYAWPAIAWLAWYLWPARRDQRSTRLWALFDPESSVSHPG